MGAGWGVRAMKSRGVALSTLGSRSGRVSNIPGTEWEGSLSLFPATGADDSAAPAGQVEGSVTTLPVTSVELQNLSIPFHPGELAGLFPQHDLQSWFSRKSHCGEAVGVLRGRFSSEEVGFPDGGAGDPWVCSFLRSPSLPSAFLSDPQGSRTFDSPGWSGAVRQPTGSVFPCSPKQVKSPITGPSGTASLSDSSLF